MTSVKRSYLFCSERRLYGRFGLFWFDVFRRFVNDRFFARKFRNVRFFSRKWRRNDRRSRKLWYRRQARQSWFLQVKIEAEGLE